MLQTHEQAGKLGVEASTRGRDVRKGIGETNRTEQTLVQVVGKVYFGVKACL